MKRIIDSLKRAIKTELDLYTVLIPQTADNTTKKIELFFVGIEPCGISQGSDKRYEKLTLSARFISKGTHESWMIDTMNTCRKLAQLEAVGAITLDFKNLKSLWTRVSPGQFIYPSEDESSMPVGYEQLWKIEIDYPPHFLDDAPEAVKGE